jgi:hypothetical protein
MRVAQHLRLENCLNFRRLVTKCRASVKCLYACCIKLVSNTTTTMVLLRALVNDLTLTVWRCVRDKFRENPFLN